MSLRAKRPRQNQRLSLEMPIRGLSWTGVRFSAPPPIVTGRWILISTCLFISCPYRGESNSMQGAGVRKTRKRFLPAGEDAGRRPKPVRICEANTRILRENFDSKRMRCLSNLSRPCAASTDPLPHRGESNSVQGAGVKKTPWQRRPGRAFPMAAQAESPSRNPASDWDVVSG